MDKKRLKEIAILVIAVIAVYIFFTYGLKIILGTEIPLAVVESKSMEPTLNVGDIIISKGIDPNDLKVGDIIIFQLSNSNTFIVHRIVEIIKDENGLLIKTKGDNNPIEDPWIVRPSQIKGIVIFKIPYLGYISLVLQKTPQLYFALIILLIILMIIPQTKKKNRAFYI